MSNATIQPTEQLEVGGWGCRGCGWSDLSADVCKQEAEVRHEDAANIHGCGEFDVQPLAWRLQAARLLAEREEAVRLLRDLLADVMNLGSASVTMIPSVGEARAFLSKMEEPCPR